MKAKNRHKLNLLCCLLSLVVLVAGYQGTFNKDYKKEDGGIFDGGVYDDTVGELSVREKQEYAAHQKRHYESQASNNDETLSEDEPQESLDPLEAKKDWFLDHIRDMEEITNHEKFNLNLDQDEARLADQDARQSSPHGETEADRRALLREEEKQRRENELKAKKVSLEDEAIPKAGELFEGDIIMSDHLRDHILSMGKNKRDGLVEKNLLWPRDPSDPNSVRIPYAMHPDFVYNDYNEDKNLKKKRLDEAIQDFNDYTCIRLVPKTDDDKDYVHFISKKSMCFSSVGKRGGKQDISIGNGCERLGTVQHEIMHASGLIHEQSRPDRDDYVKVRWSHIRKKLVHNFKKYPSYLVKKNVDYDFDSVMHYHNTAFSSDGGATLVDIKDPSRKFGQRKRMSMSDVIELNRLYGCEQPSKELLQDLPYP